MITLNGQAAFRWDLEKMIHQTSYRAHAAVTAATFSDDGKLAATASRSVRLWNPLTGKSIDKLEIPHRGAVTGLDFADGRRPGEYRIATSGGDDAARLWSWSGAESGFRLIREFKIDGSQVSTVRFTPNGDSLMVASQTRARASSPVDRPGFGTNLDHPRLPEDRMRIVLVRRTLACRRHIGLAWLADRYQRNPRRR